MTFFMLFFPCSQQCLKLLQMWVLLEPPPTFRSLAQEEQWVFMYYFVAIWLLHFFWLGQEGTNTEVLPPAHKQDGVVPFLSNFVFWGPGVARFLLQDFLSSFPLNLVNSLLCSLGNCSYFWSIEFALKQNVFTAKGISAGKDMPALWRAPLGCIPWMSCGQIPLMALPATQLLGK